MFSSSSFLYAILFRAHCPPSGHPFISRKHLLPLVLGSNHSLEGRHTTFSTQTFVNRDTDMDSIHTVQTEVLLSKILCPQRLDELEGRTDRHLAPVQEGGCEEQEGEELSCSPGCRRACTWAPACSGSSPAACGWSWTPRWTWSALHPYTSPEPGREGWWEVTWNGQ